jgi:hypothetical protein
LVREETMSLRHVPRFGREESRNSRHVTRMERGETRSSRHVRMPESVSNSVEPSVLENYFGGASSVSRFGAS